MIEHIKTFEKIEKKMGVYDLVSEISGIKGICLFLLFSVFGVFQLHVNICYLKNIFTNNNALITIIWLNIQWENKVKEKLSYYTIGFCFSDWNMSKCHC